jgi:hypothetical protein
MAYGLLFKRLGILLKDRRLARFAKWQIFKACRLRLSKINQFASGLAAKLYAARKKSEVTRVIGEFKESRSKRPRNHGAAPG